MPLAIYALMIGAFGIGTTEFVIMGLLPQMSADLGVSLSAAGLLVSGYALGVAVGAPLLSLLSARLPRKSSLMVLMLIFTLGNLICALAPNYTVLMVARVITSFAHGTFFGIGSIVATSLVKPNQKASAIALMFTGLTIANILGVPFGTWLGQAFGWRSTFWAVTAIGPLAFAALAFFVPRDKGENNAVNFASELRTVLKPQVLTSLVLTMLGFAGVFAVFTYIAPILTKVSGFSESAISPILLLFGVGLIFGNIVGGKAADKKLMPTLVGSLVALAAVLFAFGFLSHSQIGVVVLVALLGFTGFATVPPLQMRALDVAQEAPTLASALNIAAFNVGNALGAWVGGLVLDHGGGLNAIPWAAGLITVASVVIAVAEAKRPCPKMAIQ
ncbi:MFS transporter [Bdellovibrio sp. 22V]|uniref:MFS transporter n=1 Tax=Bdellovibrio TaxID=958 RepID=UPI0025435E0A|nr:MFS transporter [Bdellovibrio sp. 22V]WII73919.1 MFS transporter [Bdellovibrio sp. 22V]